MHTSYTMSLWDTKQQFQHPDSVENFLAGVPLEGQVADTGHMPHVLNDLSEKRRGGGRDTESFSTVALSFHYRL